MNSLQQPHEVGLRRACADYCRSCRDAWERGTTSGVLDTNAPKLLPRSLAKAT